MRPNRRSSRSPRRGPGPVKASWKSSRCSLRSWSASTCCTTRTILRTSPAFPRATATSTAIALNIAEHVAVENKLPVAIFSMEMSGSQLAMRLLGSIGRLDQHKLRTGRLSDDDWNRLTNAVGKLHDAPILVDESGALNALELRARARRLHRQYGHLGLIVVDYLQLMQATSQGENRATEISEISRSLKSLAKELKVPVVALSQLSRAVEQRTGPKRPIMSDLRESGAIEQDADLILAIYREEVYTPDTPEKGVAEIIILKQRNGPIGTIKLTFLGEYTRFENYAQAARTSFERFTSSALRSSGPPSRRCGLWRRSGSPNRADGPRPLRPRRDRAGRRRCKTGC